MGKSLTRYSHSSRAGGCLRLWPQGDCHPVQHGGSPGPNITPTPLQQPSAVPKPVATIAGGSPSGGGTSLPSASPEPTPTREFEIITVIPRDAIRAILEPEFLSVEEAIYHEPDEPVLGVSINGDNRAYSIPQLSRHEIVNDVVGGVPIAVTW